MIPANVLTSLFYSCRRNPISEESATAMRNNARRTTIPRSWSAAAVLILATRIRAPFTATTLCTCPLSIATAYYIHIHTYSPALSICTASTSVDSAAAWRVGSVGAPRTSASPVTALPPRLPSDRRKVRVVCCYICARVTHAAQQICPSVPAPCNIHPTATSTVLAARCVAFNKSFNVVVHIN